MSIVNTSANTFTYTPETSSNNIYIANNNDNKIEFEVLHAYDHYIMTDANKHMTTIDPLMLTFNYASTDIPANTETTIGRQSISASHTVAIITTMIPIQVDDFTTLTSSDSITITFKSKTTVIGTVTVPFNKQPVTMINNVYAFKNIPAGPVSINVTSTVPATYIKGANSIDNIALASVNANTLICF